MRKIAALAEESQKELERLRNAAAQAQQQPEAVDRQATMDDQEAKEAELRRLQLEAELEAKKHTAQAAQALVKQQQRCGCFAELRVLGCHDRSNGIVQFGCTC